MTEENPRCNHYHLSEPYFYPERESDMPSVTIYQQCPDCLQEMPMPAMLSEAK